MVAKALVDESTLDQLEPDVREKVLAGMQAGTELARKVEARARQSALSNQDRDVQALKKRFQETILRD